MAYCRAVCVSLTFSTICFAIIPHQHKANARLVQHSHWGGGTEAALSPRRPQGIFVLGTDYVEIYQLFL